MHKFTTFGKTIAKIVAKVVFIMPRMARVKSIDSVYHIICRSISEVPLFKDARDKDKYLKLIKRYQGTFMFKVYAYCLMDSHVHMIIDAGGADISKVMHGINQSYVQYFKKSRVVKALPAFLTNGLCNMKQKDICAYMGNITQSHASRLCQRGYDLISETQEYKYIITDFIKRKAC